MKDTQTVYELAFHLLPTFSEEEAAAVVTSLKARIESEGGEIISEEAPGQFTLAYDMTRSIENRKEWFSESYFAWIKFTATPENAQTLNTDLTRDERIIRFLLVKTVRENTFIAKKFNTGKHRKAEDKVEGTEEAGASPVEAENAEETVSANVSIEAEDSATKE